MRRAVRGLLALLLVGLLALLLWPEAKPGPTCGWLKAAGLEARFETLSGLRVRYVRAGDGPAVVLLHGFASSIFTWKDVLPGLARSRTVVALDFPGFGESEQPPALDVGIYPGIVLGLMDRLGIARASLPAAPGGDEGRGSALRAAAGPRPSAEARPAAGVSRPRARDRRALQRVPGPAAASRCPDFVAVAPGLPGVEPGDGRDPGLEGKGPDPRPLGARRPLDSGRAGGPGCGRDPGRAQGRAR